MMYLSLGCIQKIFAAPNIYLKVSLINKIRCSWQNMKIIQNSIKLKSIFERLFEI